MLGDPKTILMIRSSISVIYFFSLIHFHLSRLSRICCCRPAPPSTEEMVYLSPALAVSSYKEIVLDLLSKIGGRWPPTIYANCLARGYHGLENYFSRCSYVSLCVCVCEGALSNIYKCQVVGAANSRLKLWKQLRYSCPLI